VHLNPNGSEPINRILKGINDIIFIDLQDDLPFIYPMTITYIILTDSGSIKEEVPSLGKPVLVMRDTTELPEVVDTGMGALG
jgi:UDP-N-acetylglucosamine 2-epimerase (non-hydrolysing)